MSDSMPENYGQGESGPIGDTAPVGNEVGTESTTDSHTESTGYNPSWNEALELLPDDYLRDKVKPVFEKWDTNNNERYTKLQQQYEPYKELIEHNVEFDRIKAAFEFQNKIANSPEEAFKALGTHLGYDIDAVMNAIAGQGQGETPNPDDAEDPRLTELRKNQEGMLNLLAEQELSRQQKEQEIQEKQYYTETVTELDRLTEKYGQFDRNRAVREALWVSEQSGKPVDLEAGVRALAELAKTAFKNSPSANAPGVFAGNGSLASGRVDTSKMSDKEFQDYAVARMTAINGG